MNKPNQIIDEITGCIYPPQEAIIHQLMTIRAIIPPTIDMYKATTDIHSIQPNLDMIQRAIKYLRGAPPIDFPEEPEEPNLSINADVWTDTDIAMKGVALNEEEPFDFLINIIGKDIIPKNEFPEMFGDTLPEQTVIAGINLASILEPGKKYHITQINPALENYKDDENIKQVDGKWIKQKDYEITEEDKEEGFLYLFLLPAGTNVINIDVFDLTDDKVLANIKVVAECEFA